MNNKNNLRTIQNQDVQIARIGASRQKYSDAKRAILLQMSLTLGAALFSSLLIVNDTYKAVGIFYGLIVFIVDLFLIQVASSKLKEAAAKIQEEFDCDVLDMAWPKQKAGARVDHAEVRITYLRYERQAGSAWPLKNWYTPERLSELPIVAARVVCQKTNCYWSENQGRAYLQILATLGMLLFLPYTIYAIATDISLKDYFSLVVPVLPAIYFCFRQWREHNDAATKMGKLKDDAKSLLNEIYNGSVEQSSDYAKRARDIQDEIFDARKRNPLIFDFLFRKSRDKYEDATATSAEQDVNNYHSSNFKRTETQP